MFVRLLEIFFLTTLLVMAESVYAGIRPSFSLDYSSWEATDIVFASEGEIIDGRFVVLESLKGDLLPGEPIDLPELAKFKTKSSRRVKLPFGAKGIEPPQYVTGQRMILFLKRKIGTTEAVDLKGGVNPPNWQPTDVFDEMSASVVWLEGNQSFAFIQWSNPGASELIDYGKSETELRKRSLEVTQIRTSLNEAAALTDGSIRAEALASFATSEFQLARLLAFEELQKGGQQSLSVLKSILKDESKLDVHDDAIKSLAVIGGEKIGPILTEIVRTEMLFWKATAPKLSQGWWNALNDPKTKALQGRYSKVLEALSGLRKLRFIGSRDVVFEFRNFWRSLPQLEDESGIDQMSETCDEVLKSLQSYD